MSEPTDSTRSKTLILTRSPICIHNAWAQLIANASLIPPYYSTVVMSSEETTQSMLTWARKARAFVRAKEAIGSCLLHHWQVKVVCVKVAAKTEKPEWFVRMTAIPRISSDMVIIGQLPQ